MARTKKAPAGKRAGQPPPENSSDSDSSRSDGSSDDHNMKNGGRKRNFVSMKNRESLDQDDEGQCTEHQMVSRLSFCCYHCTCTKERRDRVQGYPWVIASGSYWYHRRCCHEAFEPVEETWATPFVVACNEISELLLQQVEEGDDESQWNKSKKRGKKKKKKNMVDLADMRERYTNAAKLESRISGVTSSPPKTPNVADPNYEASKNKFEGIKEEWDQLGDRSCVVLDLFAGVGSHVVSLKRCKVRIGKVIHCENDKVATEVYRSNHNGNEDAITHCYEPDFCNKIFDKEGTINEKRLKRLMREHGPIDLVIAGLPWDLDRAGSIGRKEHLGRVCSLIREIRKHPTQTRPNRAAGAGSTKKLKVSHPLLYLVESPNINKKKNQALVERVKKMLKLEWGPIKLDAQLVSPVARNRQFYTNIYLPMAKMKATEENNVCSLTCLRDGYAHAAAFCPDDSSSEEEEGEDGKCNTAFTFLPAPDVYDDRMLVYKENEEEPGFLQSRMMSCSEREDMMGLPSGYVSEPVSKMFDNILSKAFVNLADDPENETFKHWRDQLSKKYHGFAGNYHNFQSGDAYQFAIRDGYDQHGARDASIQLQMCPPAQKAEAELAMDKDKYGNHLVGNSASVPVLDLFFSSLREVFGQKEYGNYKYTFKWLAQRSASDGMPIKGEQCDTASMDAETEGEMIDTRSESGQDTAGIDRMTGAEYLAREADNHDPYGTGSKDVVGQHRPASNSGIESGPDATPKTGLQGFETNAGDEETLDHLHADVGSRGGRDAGNSMEGVTGPSPQNCPSANDRLGCVDHHAVPVPPRVGSRDAPTHDGHIETLQGSQATGEGRDSSYVGNSMARATENCFPSEDRVDGLDYNVGQVGLQAQDTQPNGEGRDGSNSDDFMQGVKPIICVSNLAFGMKEDFIAELYKIAGVEVVRSREYDGDLYLFLANNPRCGMEALLWKYKTRKILGKQIFLKVVNPKQLPPEVVSETESSSGMFV